MAVIVEVATDREDYHQKPQGPEGRYTGEQKGKNVPRTSAQREFLRQFVTRPSASPKPRHLDSPTSPTPAAGSSASRRPPTTPLNGGRVQKQSGSASVPFRRDASEVPDGGWFRATTAAGGRGGGRGPPSSSSSSTTSSSTSHSGSSDGSSSSSESESTSSSSDSDTQSSESSSSKNARRLKRAMQGVKTKPPCCWKSAPDLDVFDQWTYEIDTWGELLGLSDRLMLKLVVQFMSDKPTTRQEEWTMKDLYEALFDYCFPSDYKRRLRARLEAATQGRSRIQQLAVRFPDVSDFQLVQIFWKGVHPYIRVHLIEKGLNPEKTKLDRLVKHAVRREDAYEEARREDRAFEGQVSGRSWGRFSDRSTGPEPLVNLKPEASRQSGEPVKGSMHSKPKPSGSKRETSGPPQRERTNKLSKDEMNRLRAEGRCFNCKDTGHESRNCPARKTAPAPKRPGVNAGSVHFANLEKLAQRVHTEDAPSGGRIQVGSVRIAVEQQQAPTLPPVGIWARAHQEDCVEYLRTLFVSYFDVGEALTAGMDPEDRFSVSVYNNDTFEVSDWLAPQGLPSEYLVTRQQMDDDSYGVPEILQAEWDDWISLPPRAEWGTGFPPCDAPDDSHPALYWLRAHLRAHLRTAFPDLVGQTSLVSVECHALGYLLRSQREDSTYLANGHALGVCENIRERRQKLMVCAARPVQSRRKRKGKPDAPSDQKVQGIKRNAMRPKDASRMLPVPLVV
ncbi:hypothetical protein OH76DRAFT_1458450 [Lentinus brumalis]|uniref:CCHC-type domain-containing protein n=1 Tax=Lentinus brumalis TaxID=2498619 RepID=A0A371CSM7_9APHY|nr:hypothetical protein OH76DRAFT_1458450 [Polyporus brumalis]